MISYAREHKVKFQRSPFMCLSTGAPIFFLHLHWSNIEATNNNTFFNLINMGIAVLRLKRK